MDKAPAHVQAELNQRYKEEVDHYIGLDATSGQISAPSEARSWDASQQPSAQVGPHCQRNDGRSATMTPSGLACQAAGLSTTLVQPPSRALKCLKAFGASSSVSR